MMSHSQEKVTHFLSTRATVGRGTYFVYGGLQFYSSSVISVVMGNIPFFKWEKRWSKENN